MLEILKIQNFDLVDDPVKTEETIYNQLCQNKESIYTDCVYVAFPIAFSINKIGLSRTQNIIDKVCRSNANKKLFFVCQHILVNKLNFYNNIVFTPHATILDNYVPIPHYSCTYNTKRIKPWSERKYLYSFMGSFITHPIRKKIYEVLKDRDDCLIIDTGQWHFEGAKEKQKNNSKTYEEVLGNTKFSLCPRGTGPSTIRIWESMAMGAKPIIISDFLKMPMEMFMNNLPWSRVPEAFTSLQTNDKPYDNSEYWEYFSNKNLYKTIIRALELW
mgnify:CR=1 FL=1|tara:strand:- start:2514 stop:3332 length:819 start_codon:yes stop_codon:yes gene_type:complete